jgi:SAM-dependent methyltransferase
MEEFRRYWSQKGDSDYTQRPNLDVFKIAADEIRVYFDPSWYKRILDIGCGAGEVFEYLKFDPNHYLGVDFSPSMLRAFAERHPKVRLMEGDAPSFLIPEKFDFILINGVIQYCSPEATRKCIANLKQMLSEAGAILVGNVPNRSLRYKYECGLFLDKRPSIGRMVINVCKTATNSVLKRHLGIGYWYTTDQIRKIAAKQELDTWFFGSLLYPYRFSVLMRHRSTTPRSTRSKSEDLGSGS